MATKVGALPTRHRYLFRMKVQKAFAENVLKEKVEAFKAQAQPQHKELISAYETIKNLKEPKEETADLAPLEAQWGAFREAIKKKRE